MGSYEQQFMQQYQQQQNQSQFRLQQMPSLSQTFRDQGIKPIQSPQPAPDPYGILGLLSVIRMSDPDLTSLALGIDLTTLGLNLNSSENLHKTFASPWSEEPAKGEPEFTIPECYHAKQPHSLSVSFLNNLLLLAIMFDFVTFLFISLALAASLFCKVPAADVVLHLLQVSLLAEALFLIIYLVQCIGFD